MKASNRRPIVEQWAAQPTRLVGERLNNPPLGGADPDLLAGLRAAVAAGLGRTIARVKAQRLTELSAEQYSPTLVTPPPNRKETIK